MISVWTSRYKNLIEKTLKRMSSMPEFDRILVTRGHLDTRKRVQFGNVVKLFAKLRCRDFITSNDVDEARYLFLESARTLNESFGKDLLKLGLNDVEIDIIVFVKPGTDFLKDDFDPYVFLNPHNFKKLRAIPEPFNSMKMHLPPTMLGQSIYGY